MNDALGTECHNIRFPQHVMSRIQTQSVSGYSVRLNEVNKLSSSSNVSRVR